MAVAERPVPRLPRKRNTITRSVCVRSFLPSILRYIENKRSDGLYDRDVCRDYLNEMRRGLRGIFVP